MCSAVIVIAAVSLAPLAARGWIPHDEGTLAQSAHRILLGQLPHRDFDEVYTGGLSFLHAAAFRAFGENLATLRLVLLTAAVCVTPIVYYIASRFASALAAGGLTIVALAWGFPIYPASMPSWYNLIFALCGCAALLRYIETDHRRWLLVAGICAGTSIIVKIVGVYFVAAAALFLFFDVSTRSSPRYIACSQRTAVGLTIVLSLALAVAPIPIMGRGAAFADLIELALPIAVTGVGAAVVISRRARRGRPPQLSQLVLAAGPFALGVLIPIAAFAAVYVNAHAIGPLLRGVFILPRKRLQFATLTGPPIIALLIAIPLVRVLLSRRYSERRLNAYDIVIIAAVNCGLIAWSIIDFRVADLLWLSGRMAGPVLIVAGVVILTRNPAVIAPSPDGRRLFVMLAVTAWCALVQFPYAFYIYFGYVAPLVILTAGAIVRLRATLSPRLAASLLLTYAALGFFGGAAFIKRDAGQLAVPKEIEARLDLPRGGLTIRREDRDVYVGVAALVQKHSRSRYIYVTPDAPEVYFLSERENPTRTIFDFFDDPNNRERRILAEIRTHRADMVVINTKPGFSGKVPSALYDSLAQQFPQATTLGKFEVRWRSSS